MAHRHKAFRDRRLALTILVLLITAGMGAVSCTDGLGLLNPQPPNVIVILPDALRADRLSCYAQRPVDGYTGNQTPHIDSLARDGVLYRRMNAQAAWTKPSVATILSSLYPSTHQARRPKDILPDDVLTLPEVLAAHEYHTVGFVTNTNLFPSLNFQQGFTEYYALDPDETSWLHDGQKFYQEAELVNRRVLSWLEANHGRRFFMYIHYMDPHRPYFEHPYNGRAYYDEDPARTQEISAVYDGEVSYIDEHVGELLAALKRLGIYEETLIVLTSDHGEEFYEHQGWGHGQTLYQEIMSVPLIIKYPGNAGAGTVDEELTRSLDIAPTVLDMAGVQVPATMHGTSLRSHPDARPSFVFAEDVMQAGVLALRTSRYKLIEVTHKELRGRSPTQLYDLEVDPGETTNLAKAQPEVVARLRQDLSYRLTLAERAALGGQEADLDPAFMERLHRLGY